jgi:glycosyltransferase involved in cell wall biosynthesis
MDSNNPRINIKIITLDAFPIGMATTNRIMSYAKGLVENNCNVSVHCIKPTENHNQVFNKLSSGIVDGIYFKYSSGKTIKNTKYLNRQIDNFNGVLRICIDILKEKKSDKTDAIIYYATSTFLAFLLFFITRLKNILFLKEENEIPDVHTKNKFLLNKFLFNRIHYTLPDGLLLMTKRLIKYFKEEKKVKKPFLHVPMTVDFDRFNNIKIKNNTNKYIAYCGELNNKKDGVDLLIDAFAILTKDFPDLSLYLIGNAASDEELQVYKKKIIQYQLSKKVLLTGRISKDAIPELLCNATLLALARPESPQAENGFPTKLGEYLATGKPVVVTSVGEIPNYLTNEINVFMAEPGSINSLVSKIKTILLDYSHALEIGENGKKVAIEHFNNLTQAKNILNFIKSFTTSVIL